MTRLTALFVAILLVGCTTNPQTSKDSVAVKANADVYYAQGARQVKGKNWSTALALYKKALSVDSKDSRAPLAMYYIGVCHQELGNKQEAIAAYNAFIKKYPPHPKAAKARANLAKKFGAVLSQPESEEPEEPGREPVP